MTTVSDKEVEITTRRIYLTIIGASAGEVCQQPYRLGMGRREA
jgi:hypothetical protein